MIPILPLSKIMPILHWKVDIIIA